MLGTIVLILLILLIVGALPTAPWNAGRTWGYYPSMGGMILLLVVLFILFSHRLVI